MRWTVGVLQWGLRGLVAVHILLVSARTHLSTDLKLPVVQTGVLVLAWLWALFRLNGARPPRAPAPASRWAFAAVVAYLAVSAVAALRSDYRLASLYEVGLRITCAMLFWVVSEVFTETKAVRRLAFTLVACGLVVSLYGILQSMGIDVFVGAHGVIATLGNANYLAGFQNVWVWGWLMSHADSQSEAHTRSHQRYTSLR